MAKSHWTLSRNLFAALWLISTAMAYESYSGVEHVANTAFGKKTRKGIDADTSITGKGIVVDISLGKKKGKSAMSTGKGAGINAKSGKKEIGATSKAKSSKKTNKGKLKGNHASLRKGTNGGKKGGNHVATSGNGNGRTDTNSSEPPTLSRAFTQSLPNPPTHSTSLNTTASPYVTPSTSPVLNQSKATQAEVNDKPELTSELNNRPEFTSELNNRPETISELNNTPEFMREFISMFGSVRFHPAPEEMATLGTGSPDSEQQLSTSKATANNELTPKTRGINSKNHPGLKTTEDSENVSVTGNNEEAKKGPAPKDNIPILDSDKSRTPSVPKSKGKTEKAEYLETPEDTVVRELSIFAFEYTTASTEEANKTDYDELAVATYEIAQQAYATFFEGVDEVHFLSTEMYQYVIHAPRVVDFKILLLFRLPGLTPSQSQLEDLASQAFGVGGTSYMHYLNRLSESKSPIFSSTVSMQYIDEIGELENALHTANEGSSQGNLLTSKAMMIIAPIAVAAFALAFFFFIFTYRRYNRRTLDEGKEGHVSSKRYRDTEHISVADTSTCETSEARSQYRTGVFSEEGIGQQSFSDQGHPRTLASKSGETTTNLESLEEVSLDEMIRKDGAGYAPNKVKKSVASYEKVPYNHPKEISTYKSNTANMKKDELASKKWEYQVSKRPCETDRTLKQDSAPKSGASHLETYIAAAARKKNLANDCSPDAEKEKLANDCNPTETRSHRFSSNNLKDDAPKPEWMSKAAQKKNLANVCAVAAQKKKQENACKPPETPSNRLLSKDVKDNAAKPEWMSTAAQKKNLANVCAAAAQKKKLANACNPPETPSNRLSSNDLKDAALKPEGMSTAAQNKNLAYECAAAAQKKKLANACNPLEAPSNRFSSNDVKGNASKPEWMSKALRSPDLSPKPEFMKKVLRPPGWKDEPKPEWMLKLAQRKTESDNDP